MPSAPSAKACVSCGRDDSSAVLLPICFHGRDRWICSQCFPVLIHNPAKLAGRLEGAETLTPAKHDDD